MLLMGAARQNWMARWRMFTSRFRHQSHMARARDRRMESAFGVFAVVEVSRRALEYFFIARQQPHAEGTGENETYLVLAGVGK